ncbi:helix-turn-helix domain-containing protein [Leptospira noguchii]|uniref:AraC family transcriptional regulator n=1 Tax=Leptospira noguchii TaxID=28182 RepID=UPI0011467B91|nr:helix-turn-helix domain-containing protein [Leptospira noguchii]TQE83617.1 AraC family transcriptional regulator [Leptospira noguchii]UOG31339.1 helix-turn-helix domain-containing protein [Leptospira noguchii]UOG51862.1 helix-turn-helix domain-containing protein [Leptospira noguchii]
MDFFPDLNFLDYLIFLKEALNRYLEYLYSASIVISFLTGLSGFYKATKSRLNLVRGIFLMSACFLIIGHSKAFAFMTSDPNGILNLEMRIFFSYYYGFAVCASLSSTFYVMYLFGSLQNPLRLSLYSFLSFPVIFLISLMIEDLISIVYFGKSVLFTLQFSAGIFNFHYVIKNKMKKIYLNYPIQNFTLCTALIVHSIGMWLGMQNLMILALSFTGFFIIYFFILEYNHPEFWKVSFSSELLEIKSEDSKTQTLQTSPKNLVERLDISRIEEKIQKFVEDREYLDEEIRLSDFSAYIGLSLHQASYYLNNYKDLSFTDFLSFHRLEEAKRMIEQRPDINLLEVALASGFNSPSSFRRACLKFTGKPPKEFRNYVLHHQMTPSMTLEFQNQLG